MIISGGSYERIPNGTDQSINPKRILVQHPRVIASITILILASIIVSLFFNHFLFKFLKKLIATTSTKWDDILLNNEFFQRLGLLLPLVLVYFSLDIVFGIEIAKAAAAASNATGGAEALVATGS
jgi:hypothetical protein